MQSRKFDDLGAEIQMNVAELLTEARRNDIELIITCTYRSLEEQAKLYASGRTMPGMIKTHAKPGDSLHNRTFMGHPSSWAIDVVPIVNGKPVWQTTGKDGALWQMIGQWGEEAGLEWAGRWPVKKIEFAHFQITASERSKYGKG